jgi:hypothetical protein
MTYQKYSKMQKNKSFFKEVTNGKASASLSHSLSGAKPSGSLATITCPPFGGNSFCLIAGIKTG